ncbi:porin family protein [Paracoccaceae bacterium GXU_MW_L88]
MKKHLAMGAAVLALSTTSVWAQDWSGFYLGAGVGNLEVETDVDIEEDDTAFGLHAGYRYDGGRWVVGGEIEHDWTDIELVPDAITVDRVLRLKASAGYEFGNVLAYVVGGAANVDVDGLGDEWGEFYGLGASYAFTPKASVGVELLEHNFEDIGGSGIDADAWSTSLRTSWRF